MSNQPAKVFFFLIMFSLFGCSSTIAVKPADGSSFVVVKPIFFDIRTLKDKPGITIDATSDVSMFNLYSIDEIIIDKREALLKDGKVLPELNPWEYRNRNHNYDKAIVDTITFRKWGANKISTNRRTRNRQTERQNQFEFTIYFTSDASREFKKILELLNQYSIGLN